MSNRRRRTVLGALVAIGLVLAMTSPAVATGSRGHARVEVTRGSFVTLAGGTDLGYSIRGGAVMVRGRGWTAVHVHARGLDAGTTYPAHVHNAPCSATPPGGSHYQDVVGGPVDAVNEIWPAITTNRSGRGHGFATHAHRARADAMSVVIHYPLNTSIRLACVDLT